MQIYIRPMHKEDWPGVKVIYEQGIATGKATFETKAPTWEYWDENHLSSCRLVALAEGNIVGWAALSAVSKRSVYQGVAENSVYVSSEATGLGIGQKLLQELLHQAKKDQFWTIQATVFPENEASLYLHQKLGFRIVGRREKIAQLHGVWRDTILLEKIL